MGCPYGPGDLIAGRYRVERVIGEGGMGVVVAAEHLELGERVAIKLLLPEALRDAEAIPRFQREARAAARIPSEHVARVMDVGTLEGGTPYLVMEYLEGRDLARELEARGALPTEEAVGYVLQAAVGVAEAHALGIVHRDLKPSNLLLARLPTGRSLVKVLDFGIAKLTTGGDAHKLTKSFSALGSISYMSPEQLRTAKDVDARADVWGFGVVLFELLSAQMPFDGDSLTAIAAAISVDQPRSLRHYRPDVPVELERVILGCLEKDRERRTPSLSALARLLEPFGGKSASLLVPRILDAHPNAPTPSFASLPSIPTGLAPVSIAATPKSEFGLTRPSWSTDDDAEPPTLKRRQRTFLPILLAGIGALLLLGLGVGVALSRTGTAGGVAAGVATESPAPILAASAPKPSESALSAPTASETAESVPIEPPSAEPDPVPEATPPATQTPTRSAPKKSTPSRRVKKPLVTHL